MSLLTTLAICTATGAFAWVGVRQHRRQKIKRRMLLDGCLPLFDTHDLTQGGDGFPRLKGTCAGRTIDVRLISDGMTIRRLPQLWLQVTELARLDSVSGFSVLVRPSGYEFFSLTSRFHHVIKVPPQFPREVIIRGEDAVSVASFNALEKPIGDILDDPRVKEIAVTPRGLRIIRQTDEGRRGEYLLLRQATFDGTAVSAEVLADACRELETLRAAIDAGHARGA